jgi:V8-like Glu-specific endopeptidase
MQGMYRWRLGALLAATLTSASALVLAAAPAHAQPAAGAAAATKAASGNVSAPATVTADAWAAGRAAYGKDVTAAQVVTAYWTPERMHAATKIEDSKAYLDAVRNYDRAMQVKRDQVRMTPNRAPDAPARPHSVAPKPGSVDKPAGMAPAAYDPGYAYWQPTARTSGKVFFTMGGSGFQCSATIVNSEGQNTVWTAGHCVNQGGGSGVWATNWQFVPAYDDDLWWNPRPYGTWTATQLWSRTAWTNSSDFAEDMGVAIMGVSFGYHIVGYLGGQGITTGVGNRVWENAFGYPAESPFDGGNLYECWGTSSPEWEVLWWWSETIQIPCDMTRGSSGGGWLYGWDGNWGYLNGVNSRIDRIVSPTIMLSPYFDDTAWSLYNATRYL